MLPDEEFPTLTHWDAVCEVIKRAGVAWDRIVSILNKGTGIPQSEVDHIEQAVAAAYDGWSEAQRRSIWLQTESGMDDEDDEDLASDNFGYFLQCEILDQVLQAAEAEAGSMKSADAKRTRIKSSRRRPRL